MPGDELRLRIVDEELWEWFQQTLLEKLGPIINERWRPAKWTSLKDLFMIRYSKEKQPDLHLHNDLSFFSCSIKLRTACQGGYLNFPRQNFNDCFVGNGDLLVWPAKITHPHMVMPTTKGTRVSLVVWTND